MGAFPDLHVLCQTVGTAVAYWRAATRKYKVLSCLCVLLCLSFTSGGVTYATDTKPAETNDLKDSAAKENPKAGTPDAPLTTPSPNATIPPAPLADGADVNSKSSNNAPAETTPASTGTPPASAVDGAASENSRKPDASQPEEILSGSVRLDVTQELSKYGIELGPENKGGRVVASVKSGSSAHAWGIKVGDIVRNIKKPSALQLERNGKQSEVDLTRDKALYVAISRMAGRYFGRVSDPTEFIGGGTRNFHDRGSHNAMWTELFVSQRGVITGSYSENAGVCVGYLTDAKVISPQQVSFTWRDSAGYGCLMVGFSADYKSFQGLWNYQHCYGHEEFLTHFGPTTRLLKWYGTRR